MNAEPRKLSPSDVLRLRQEAVTSAERAFKGSKGRRARHSARLRLARNRRALQAHQEAHDAAH